MSTLRPWFCEYRVDDDGSIRLKIAWENFPHESTTRHLTFRTMEDLPIGVRRLVRKAMALTGCRFGRFDFPTPWAAVGLPSPRVAGGAPIPGGVDPPRRSRFAASGSS